MPSKRSWCWPIQATCSSFNASRAISAPTAACVFTRSYSSGVSDVGLRRTSCGTQILPTSWICAASASSATRAGDQPASSASRRTKVATRSECSPSERVARVDRPRQRPDRRQRLHPLHPVDAVTVGELVHRVRRVDDDRVAALALRRVQRPVGQPKELAAAVRMGQVGDTCRHGQVRRDPDRRGSKLRRPALGDRQRLLGVRLGEQQRELVAADAAEDVACPRAHLENPRGVHQRRVARLVPVCVVDALEVVEVEQHQRERPAVTLRTADLAFDPLLERTVVEQPGQRIARRLRQQPGARVRVRDRQADQVGERRPVAPRDRLALVLRHARQRGASPTAPGARGSGRRHRPGASPSRGRGAPVAVATASARRPGRPPVRARCHAGGAIERDQAARMPAAHPPGAHHLADARRRGTARPHPRRPRPHLQPASQPARRSPPARASPRLRSPAPARPPAARPDRAGVLRAGSLWQRSAAVRAARLGILGTDQAATAMRGTTGSAASSVAYTFTPDSEPDDLHQPQQVDVGRHQTCDLGAVVHAPLQPDQRREPGGVEPAAGQIENQMARLGAERRSRGCVRTVRPTRRRRRRAPSARCCRPTGSLLPARARPTSSVTPGNRVPPEV